MNYKEIMTKKNGCKSWMKKLNSLKENQPYDLVKRIVKGRKTWQNKMCLSSR